MTDTPQTPALPNQPAQDVVDDARALLVPEQNDTVGGDAVVGAEDIVQSVEEATEVCSIWQYVYELC
ncbi:MAG: hypothetical protein ACRYGR_00735 [Janthinobacterium lividum]